MSGAAGQSGCTEDGRIHRVPGMATLQEPQVTNDRERPMAYSNMLFFFLPRFKMTKNGVLTRNRF
jgi:hypothetical protein